MSIKEDFWKWFKEWFIKQRKYRKVVFIVIAAFLVIVIVAPSFISKWWNDFTTLREIFKNDSTSVTKGTQNPLSNEPTSVTKETPNPPSNEPTITTKGTPNHLIKEEVIEKNTDTETDFLKEDEVIELAKIEQGTIFIESKYEQQGSENDAFTEDPRIIYYAIRQALYDEGINVIDNPSIANYKLILITSTTQRSDGSGKFGIISYYANVEVDFVNLQTGNRITKFTILDAPDAYSEGKTSQDAATKAFKLPALREKILEKVLPNIKI